VYQGLPRPETLFRHVFGEEAGFLCAFSGKQARIANPDAPANQLTETMQRFFEYPAQAKKAGAYLVEEAQTERDAYFGVHLYRTPNSRLAVNAVDTARALWLDQDEGDYPETGPEPTAVIHSSMGRRHL
jgi:hypothetical protein